MNHTIVSKFLISDKPIDAAFCEKCRLPLDLVGSSPQFMAFSTRVDNQKTILTAIGIGELSEKGEMLVSAPGQAAFETVFAYMPKDPELIICDCRHTETARQRALNALLGAKDGSALLILCKDTHIYDAVLITKTFGLKLGPQ